LNSCSKIRKKTRLKIKNKSMITKDYSCNYKALFVLLASLLITTGSVKAQTQIPEGFPQIPSYDVIKTLIPILEKASVVIIQKEKDKPPFITGILLINEKIDNVLKVVRDFEKYHEFVPNISKIRILEKKEDGTEIVEYNLAFDVALGLKFKITYTLEQKYNENEYLIWGLPAKGKEQAFSDVRFIEKYYATEDGRTVMIYSAYADLASFGFLSKLVYKAFPELQIPTLVSVSTLFPEAVKERIEGKKIIVEPKNVDYDKIKLPQRLPIESLLPILKTYRTIIVSWHPDENGVRFFSSYSLLKKDINYVKSQITNFEEWKRVFRIIEDAKATQTENGYKVKFKIKYKILLPIELEYTQIFNWVGNTRLECEIDRREKRDIEGGFCSWDFYDTKFGTVIGYTEFSDLRTGSYFLKLLMDKIKGFGIGLRVGMVSAQAEYLRWL
jgi:hypothetical protein